MLIEFEPTPEYWQMLAQLIPIVLLAYAVEVRTSTWITILSVPPQRAHRRVIRTFTTIMYTANLFGLVLVEAVALVGATGAIEGEPGDEGRLASIVSVIVLLVMVHLAGLIAADVHERLRAARRHYEHLEPS